MKEKRKNSQIISLKFSGNKENRKINSSKDKYFPVNILVILKERKTHLKETFNMKEVTVFHQRDQGSISMLDLEKFK